MKCMKKIITLLFVYLVTAMTVSAKSTTTTLWEATYTDAIELNAEVVATFKAGDELRIYLTIPAGGANFNICYKSEANEWVDTQIPSIGNMWPWLNGGNDCYIVTLTDADITALSGQNIYIAQGENSAITKVTHYSTVEPASATELLDTAWEADWDGRFFGPQDNVMVGDEIQFTLTSPGSWAWTQFNILDAEANADAFVNTECNYGKSFAAETVVVFNFEITNDIDLEKIKFAGFGIKGDKFTLTSVKLLSYSDTSDISTSLYEIDRQQDSQNIYTLSGQQVSAPVRGLYIVNGRKVMMK